MNEGERGRNFSWREDTPLPKENHKTSIGTMIIYQEVMLVKDSVDEEVVEYPYQVNHDLVGVVGLDRVLE